MFRRRGPMRPRQFRRLMRAGGLLGLRPRRLLNQAHALQAVGQFKEAAQIFGDLSDQVANLAMPDRAGNLSLQAANALFEAGDIQPALARAQRGLTLLVQAGREWRAGVALQNMSAALRARGFNAEADALEKQFPGLHAAAGAQPAEPPPRGHLPPKCPNCGGPMHSEEIDWIDDATAECPYCGTPVRAE